MSAGNSQDIGITLNAKGDQAEIAVQKLGAAMDRIVDKLNKVESASKKGAKSAEDGFSHAGTEAMKFVGHLTGIGSAMGGMMAVAHQLKREYENMVERQKTAAEKQLHFEAQLSKAVRNSGGFLTGAELRQEALGVADRTGGAPAKAAAAMAGALSARGPTNKKEAQEAFHAVEAAMKFAPEADETEIKNLAGVALDIGKRNKMSPEQAIGFIERVGGLARTTDLKSLIENVTPALLQVQQYGGSTQESASLVAAMTQGIGDFTGEMTGTAAISLAEQLRERMPELGSTKERLEALQNDPKLAQAFLKGGKFGKKKFEAASFRAKATPTVEALLDKNSIVAKAFREGSGMLGGIHEAEEAYATSIREVNAVTPMGRLKRMFENAATQQSILNVRGGQTSVSREGLQGFLQSVGQSDLNQRVAKLLFEGKTGKFGGEAPVSAAMDLLRKEATNLRNPLNIGAGPIGGPGFIPRSEDLRRAATPAELDAATAMEKLADRLDALAKSLEANTDATKENSKTAPASSAPLIPAVPTSVPSAGLSRSH